MEKDNLYRQHILEAIEKIQRYTKDLSYSDFEHNDLIQDAVVRELEIVGEAAKHFSEEFRAQHPDVPWQQITAMRNKLIHEYFGIDVEVVWKTIKEDMAELEKQLKK